MKDRNNMVYIGIVYAVDMHRKAMQLVLNNACTIYIWNVFMNIT